MEGMQALRAQACRSRDGEEDGMCCVWGAHGAQSAHEGPRLTQSCSSSCARSTKICARINTHVTHSVIRAQRRAREAAGHSEGGRQGGSPGCRAGWGLAPRPHLWDHQLYEGSLPKDGAPPGAMDGTTWPAWGPRPARPDPQPLPSPKHDSFSACTCLPHGHQLQGPSAPPHPGLSPEGFPIPAAFLPEPPE